ncbi:hypothetical protein, partial [Streptomyces sp. NPDC093109]|uniref:hypothetical protein n=1 Tax=Streptomyces sp. NPDC093109 TaxID=3154977 RepID=UPI00344D59C6
ALTFGTLLSSQGTDASFVLTRRTFSGAFLRALSLRCFSVSVLRFRLYQTLLAVFYFAFRIPMAFGLAFAFRRVHYFSRILVRLIIEPVNTVFGMPKAIPVRV